MICYRLLDADMAWTSLGLFSHHEEVTSARRAATFGERVFASPFHAASLTKGRNCERTSFSLHISPISRTMSKRFEVQQTRAGSRPLVNTIQVFHYYYRVAYRRLQPDPLLQICTIRPRCVFTITEFPLGAVIIPLRVNLNLRPVMSLVRMEGEDFCSLELLGEKENVRHILVQVRPRDGGTYVETLLLAR